MELHEILRLALLSLAAFGFIAATWKPTETNKNAHADAPFAAKKR